KKCYIKQHTNNIINNKTITRTKQLANRAEIRVSIDWPETIRTRLQTNYKDKLTFVTNETFRSFDTQENLVLKNLLVLLQNELYHNPYVTKFLDRAWFQDWKSRSEEHTSELQSRFDLVCRLLLEKKNKN